MGSERCETHLAKRGAEELTVDVIAPDVFLALGDRRWRQCPNGSVLGNGVGSEKEIGSKVGDLLGHIGAGNSPPDSPPRHREVLGETPDDDCFFGELAN